MGALGGLIDDVTLVADDIADVGTSSLSFAGVAGGTASGITASLVDTFGAASKNAGGAGIPSQWHHGDASCRQPYPNRAQSLGKMV